MVVTELLPSKSDICSNAEDSSTDMLLVGFESYMVNERGTVTGDDSRSNVYDSSLPESLCRERYH